MPLPEPRVLRVPGGNNVEIRPAHPREAGRWIELLSRVAAEGRYIAIERVTTTRRQLARSFRAGTWERNHAAIIAATHSEVVGQLTLFRERGVYGHVAELGMSVAPEHRREGIGTALIEGAFDWAREFAVEKITLNVFPHNARALALYEKMGFVREGLRVRHAKLSYGYEDLIEMARWV